MYSVFPVCLFTNYVIINVHISTCSNSRPIIVHISSNSRPIIVYISRNSRPIIVHYSRDSWPIIVHISRNSQPINVHISEILSLSLNTFLGILVFNSFYFTCLFDRMDIMEVL